MTAVDHDEIVVTQGRVAPYDQMAQWVGLADIDPTAKVMYWHLHMHVHRQRGDHAARPSRESLAALSGALKGEYADSRLAALKRIGAIDIKRTRVGGMKTRNVYVVNDTPPRGYQGPVTLADWYDTHRQRLAERKAEKARKAAEWRAKTKGKRKAKHDEAAEPDQRVSAGQPVVRPEGLREPAAQDPGGPDRVSAGQPVVRRQGLRSPSGRTSVVPERGPEPDAFKEPDEVPPPTVLQSDAGTRPGRRRASGGGGKPRKTLKITEPRERDTVEMPPFLSALLDTYPTTSGSVVAEIATYTQQALADGWTERALIDALTHNLSTSDFVPGVWRYRLKQLGAPPAPTTTATKRCNGCGGVLERVECPGVVLGYVLRCSACPPPEPVAPETEAERRARRARIEAEFAAGRASALAQAGT